MPKETAPTPVISDLNATKPRGGTFRLPHFTSQQKLRNTLFFLLLSHQMVFLLTCWQLLFLLVTSFLLLFIHSLIHLAEWSLEMQQWAIQEVAPALTESFIPSLALHDMIRSQYQDGAICTFPLVARPRRDLPIAMLSHSFFPLLRKVCPR